MTQSLAFGLAVATECVPNRIQAWIGNGTAGTYETILCIHVRR